MISIKADIVGIGGGMGRQIRQAEQDDQYREGPVAQYCKDVPKSDTLLRLGASKTRTWDKRI